MSKSDLWSKYLRPILLGMVGVALAYLTWHLYVDHLTADAVRQILQQQQKQQAPQPAGEQK